MPFLYGGVVNEYQWLNERQFVDAVAVAMITPGPVVITVGFIGYLVAGFPGAVVASLATFLPCYFFTIIPAPYFKKHGKQPGIVAFVDGVTAAAIGTIAGAVVVLGKRAIVDLPTLLLAVVTVILLWKFKKLTEPPIVAAAALIGLVVYPLVRRGAGCRKNGGTVGRRFHRARCASGGGLRDVAVGEVAAVRAVLLVGLLDLRDAVGQHLGLLLRR